MEITGRNKLIVRETNREKTKVFEAELDLDLKHETSEIKTVKFLGFTEAQKVISGWVSCKGIVITKNIEYTHEEAIANVNCVFTETLKQAFRGLDESFTSQVTYSFSIIKSSYVGLRSCLTRVIPLVYVDRVILAAVRTRTRSPESLIAPSYIVLVTIGYRVSL